MVESKDFPQKNINSFCFSDSSWWRPHSPQEGLLSSHLPELWVLNPTHSVLTNFPEKCFLSFFIYLWIFKREERAWKLFFKKGTNVFKIVILISFTRHYISCASAQSESCLDGQTSSFLSLPSPPSRPLPFPVKHGREPHQDFHGHVAGAVALLSIYSAGSIVHNTSVVCPHLFARMVHFYSLRASF